MTNDEGRMTKSEVRGLKSGIAGRETVASAVLAVALGVVVGADARPLLRLSGGNRGREFVPSEGGGLARCLAGK